MRGEGEIHLLAPGGVRNPDVVGCEGGDLEDLIGWALVSLREETWSGITSLITLCLLLAKCMLCYEFV